MVYLIREARHMGIALGLDSIRYYAIDIDIRSLSDYLILKGQGVQGLSKDLKWLYRYVDAGCIRHLEPNRFVIISKNGAIGYGVFQEIPWHKREKEDILANVGVKVEYGEQLQEPVLKGTYKTVGDKEHAQIVELYATENLNMIQVGEKLERSSRTIKVHIDSHNVAVKRSGFCAACKRAQSAYASQEVERGVI